MSNLTTKKHFELFRKEVYRLQHKLGLTDWTIDVIHADCADLPKSRAWFSGYPSDSVAVIGLSLDWENDKITSKRLKRSASHELMHVMFTKMSACATDRYAPKGLFEIEEHAAIRRWENFLYGDET